MLLVYTPNLTSRVEYIVNYVLGDLVGVKYELTSDADFFKMQKGAKISYGPSSVSSHHIYSHSLLIENDIKQFNVPLNNEGEIPKLFPSAEPAFINFDVFAASFYLISRYEEYLPFKADEHGRYSSKSSIARKHNFLHQPVVNLWAQELKVKLQNTFPTLSFKERKFEFINTFDIDNAFAYKAKPVWRKFASFARGLLLFQFDEVAQRLAVWFGGKKDPYDTYDLIVETHKKFNLNSIMFFLLGDYAVLDKNISHQNKAMQKLIEKISTHMKLGIHPSYKSNSQPNLVLTEKERLQEIVDKPVIDSRQHYLKLTFPDTYNNLIVSGIKHDYTLGYADDWGFRAGTCVPFYYYNLVENKSTDLLLHPNIIMEGTFKHYLKYPVKKSIAEIEKAIDEVFGVSGVFISLWHNESLSENKNWKNWSTVYLKMVEYIANKR